jgi:signal transduction histidine kinase
MTQITRVLLENEIGVVAAHKRMSSVARLFHLTLSAQSIIATAVAEISRVVIEKTDNGWLSITVERADGGFLLTGTISYPAKVDLPFTEEALRHTWLQIPQFCLEKGGDRTAIRISVDIPRSVRITESRIAGAAQLFRDLENEEALRDDHLLDEKKNEFLSVASHELKTPLTSIMAFTKLALDAGAGEASDRVLQYLEKIDLQARKLHLLIQQLLDISGIELGKLDYAMEEKEWNGYMTELIPTLELLVPMHRLSWTPCPATVMIRMDCLRIEQVLTNLVSNAAKYSDPDTRIDIDCSSDSDGLTVCVRDEGIGISGDNISRLFDKYFREEAVADKYTGFGIGLSIAAGIVREHRGSIWAEKNEGAGSSFYFRLPLKIPHSGV